MLLVECELTLEIVEGDELDELDECELTLENDELEELEELESLILRWLLV